jgi:hypothetical protein
MEIAKLGMVDVERMGPGAMDGGSEQEMLSSMLWADLRSLCTI